MGFPLFLEMGYSGKLATASVFMIKTRECRTITDGGEITVILTTAKYHKVPQGSTM